MMKKDMLHGTDWMELGLSLSLCLFEFERPVRFPLCWQLASPAGQALVEL